MKITLLSIGKTEDGYLQEGIALYEKRLIHYINFEHIALQMPKGIYQLPLDKVKAKEAESILAKVQKTDKLFLLDEQGKEMTSKQFANFINQQLINSTNITFVIGGAYGFHQELYNRADGKIALSQLTFSHQMVRLFFVEQLYRAFTIIRNEKYHH